MPVSDEEVRQARNVIAEIVATHDEKYAPLFEILDVELQRREKRAQQIRGLVSKADLTKMRAMRRKCQKNRSGKGG